MIKKPTGNRAYISAEWAGKLELYSILLTLLQADRIKH